MAQRSLRRNGSGLTGRISQGTQGRDSASRSWERPFLMPLNSSWLSGGLGTLEQTIGISGKPWLKCSFGLKRSWGSWVSRKRRSQLWRNPPFRSRIPTGKAGRSLSSLSKILTRKAARHAHGESGAAEREQRPQIMSEMSEKPEE